MSHVFADTSYFVALYNTLDLFHEPARALTARNPELVTTEFVLTEFGSFMSRRSVRSTCAAAIRSLTSGRAARVVPATSRLLAEGLSFFERHSDKDWSLVDCTSFVLMRRLRLTDALTADRHFEQAGFRALLRKAR